MTPEYKATLDRAMDEVLDFFDDVWEDDTSQIQKGKDIIKIARKYGIEPKALNQESLDFLNEVIDSHRLMPLPDGRIDGIIEEIILGKMPHELKTQPDRMSLERMFLTIKHKAFKRLRFDEERFQEVLDVLNDWQLKIHLHFEAMVEGRSG